VFRADAEAYDALIMLALRTANAVSQLTGLAAIRLSPPENTPILVICAGMVLLPGWPPQIADCRA
jgi:hypothetical protein